MFPPLTNQPHFGADGSLFDHIWLNCADMNTAGIILSDVTDHCPTFIIVKIPDPVKNENVNICFRHVDELGMQKFESGLRCVSWSFSDDINESTPQFIRKLNDIYYSSFPIEIKFVTAKRLSKPWLSKAILNSVKTKSKYFKLYRLGLISQMIYNVITSVVKRAKANYHKSTFLKSKNNMKKTWSYIREIGCKNSAKQPLRSLVVNNIILNSYNDIAEAFHNFFRNCGL